MINNITIYNFSSALCATIFSIFTMFILFINYYFNIQLNYINIVNIFFCFFLLIDLIISKYLNIKFDISKFIHHIVAFIAIYYYNKELSVILPYRSNIFFNILYCVLLLLDIYWSYLNYKNIKNSITNLSSLFVGEYNMFRYKLID